MLRTLTRRAMIGASAIVAILVSFVFLRDLAVMNGWPPTIAYGLPVCIDALAVMALLQYEHNRARAAAITAAAAIALSFVGNAVSHLMSTGHLVPGWVSVSLVGGLPALTFGVVVHLTVSGRKEGPVWDTSTAGRETGPRSSSSASGSATSADPSETVSPAASSVARSASTKPGISRRRKSKTPRGTSGTVGDVSMSDLRSLSLNALVSKYGGSKTTWQRLKAQDSEAQGASSQSPTELISASAD